MISEHDLIVLTRDLEAHSLCRGDIGVVVHCYSDGQAYEVEFMSAEGRTLAVVTLEGDAIRALGNREILHVRELSVV